MTKNESRLNQSFFNIFFKEFVNDMTNRSEMFFNMNIMFFCKSCCFFKSHLRPEINSSNFLDGINHVNTFEFSANINFFTIVFKNILTNHCFSNMLEDSFCQIHDIFKISISFIRFHCCEFWIMSHIHSFVTEDTAKFINFFHSTNNQTFQV